MSSSSKRSNETLDLLTLIVTEPRLSARRQATRDVSAAYQSLEYAAVMEELCEAHAQAMGFTEPLTKKQRKIVMHLAFDELGVPRASSLVERARLGLARCELVERRSRRRHESDRARYSRRRARKLGTQVEKFTRLEIIERDGATCYLCGRTELADGEIHIDHVIPLSRGGTHTRDNVRVACAVCNLRKGARILDDGLNRVKSGAPDAV